MTEKIVILDFGSQVTQLIGRRLRELNVYCEIYPFNKIPVLDESVKGVVLSGSPCSVRDPKSPKPDLSSIKGKYPMLCICFGAQYIAQTYGGEVNSSLAREYGRAHLTVKEECALFDGIPKESQIWMSHGDTIARLPEGAHVIGSTEDVENAAYRIEGEDTWCVQFHPEVYHSTYGAKMLENFAFRICGCKGDWTSASFIESSIASLREQIGNDNVILGLSGGVDSSVAAVLLHKAIGRQLHCIFVNNGLLRKDEYDSVLASYQDMGLNVRGVDASELFLNALAGISSPETKRKTVGKLFVEVFDSEAQKIQNAKWLAQGTIYPDVIESAGIEGISQTIKSHHNVGGLPEKMNLQIIEPLKSLFKDEVRRIGRALGIKNSLISRHPFPGPGLSIRVLGEVTPAKLEILRNADHVFIEALRNTPAPEGWNPASGAAATGGTETGEGYLTLYDCIWQAGAILLPVRSVGVMGDERTYEYALALRAVVSTDGMTADWVHLPYEFLAKVSNDIINKVRGVNRVTYDISSKPPATIEWE